MDIMDAPEIDPNFEPQSRARSNTWPLRPKETIKDEEASRSPTIDEHHEHGTENNNKDPLGLTGGKKTGSRRNAWGNLSYADLITKAIQGTPEKRLTLSQIYDWMVQNVPYFKDKGDSNSSAGWKNSIRHNLSLHNRFMRIQNEGTGKSSWWVLNPDAKPGKAPRRRATSMDTKAFEKKRGRAKRKAEQLRAAMAGGLSPTQGGSHDFVENGLIPEDSTLPFNLSPGDFRDRTSSNASSIGRLSPIQSALEPDIDNQVPSMSPLPWQSIDSPYTSQEGFNTETLTESLREMFVGENDLNGINGDGYSDSLGLQSSLSTPSPVPQQLSPGSNYQGANGVMGSPPPPYPDHLRRSPQQTSPPSQMGTTNISTLPSNSLNFSGGSVSQGMPSHEVGGNFMSQSMDVLQNDMYEGILDMLEIQSAPNNSQGPRPPLNQFSQNTQMAQQILPQQQAMPQQPQAQPVNSANLTLQQRRQQLLLMLRSQPSESLLRQALTQRTQLALQRQQVVKQAQITPPQQRTLQQQQLLNAYELQQKQVHAQLQQQQQQQQQQQIGNNGLNVFMNQGVNSEAMELQQSMPIVGANVAPLNLPTDLDVHYSEMEATDINCDVEQVLNLERSFDENLDFNFDQSQQANQSNSDNPCVLQLSH